VLDLACGEGRHALTAAVWGGTVTAIDRDESKLETAREAARRLGVSVNWLCADLEDTWPELDVFDAVLAFNYLDRARMAQILERVATGGLLIMETFLQGQIAYGWGPTSPAHLLRPGELGTMVAPLEILHGREAIEPLDAGRERLVASVVAERRKIS
jgi:2-polyprenyl-3-methyl-5-hydroxy-6-metoxy-1,4-benzoquinol methylase